MGDQEHPLKASPSLLYQNLSCGENKFFYIHKTEVHCFNAQTKETSSLQLKEKTVIYQAKAISLNWGLVVVLAAYNGAQFWDLAKEKMLYTVAPEEEGNFISRGIAAMENLVFVGSSSGSITVIMANKEGGQNVKTLKQHREVITDIASGITEGESILVSADIAGEIVIWNSKQEVKASIPKSQGDVCTCIALTPVSIICGYGSGKIKAFDVNGNKTIEMAAHCRWINAICYSPISNVLVSAAEDLLLQFWLMPTSSDGKVTHIGSKLVNDCLLTGVAFTTDGKRIGCTAYDTEKMFLFDLPR